MLDDPELEQVGVTGDDNVGSAGDGGFQDPVVVGVSNEVEGLGRSDHVRCERASATISSISLNATASLG